MVGCRANSRLRPNKLGQQGSESVVGRRRDERARAMVRILQTLGMNTNTMEKWMEILGLGRPLSHTCANSGGWKHGFFFFRNIRFIFYSKFILSLFSCCGMRALLSSRSQAHRIVIPEAVREASMPVIQSSAQSYVIRRSKCNQ